MTELHAKPIIDNKFWIVEKDGEKFATLRKDEDNRFVLSNHSGIKIYNTKNDITKHFGKDFCLIHLRNWFAIVCHTKYNSTTV